MAGQGAGVGGGGEDEDAQGGPRINHRQDRSSSIVLLCIIIFLCMLVTNMYNKLGLNPSGVASLFTTPI